MAKNRLQVSNSGTKRRGHGTSCPYKEFLFPLFLYTLYHSRFFYVIPSKTEIYIPLP